VIKFARKVFFSSPRYFGIENSTNKTDRHDITETLLKVVLNNRSPTLNCFDGQLKVALNTINQTNKSKVLTALELKQTPVMFS
jgi:hypothetical protein